MSKKILILVLIITCLGGFLRFYKITENPPSLNGDEVSFGYSAYSILQTGKDEYGHFLPLTFKSVGDYKNPLPVYLMIPSIKLLGLNDFSVRFQNALIGTIMIPVFFIFLIKIFKERKVALIGSFFMSLSSWHIFYSRFAYEGLIASFFVLLGIWFFIKMLEGGHKYAILSAFFLMLTMYTAFAPRLFIPIFILAALFFNFRKFSRKNDIILFVVTLFILGLPLAFVSLFQGASTRLSMVFISNDIEFSRYIILKSFQSAADIPQLLFFWIKRYLNYLQPDFIFFNGLGMTLPGTLGLGLLYLFEIPWLILGILEFIKRKIPYKMIFLLWLLTAVVPDSLTNNQQHAGRLLHVVPVVLIITTLGAIQFFKWLTRLQQKYLRILFSGIFALSVVLGLTHAFLTFTVHFPRAKAEAFDEGLKEATLYMYQNQDNYKEIVFDPRRGIDGPYLVSNPYLYVLFYTKYDPYTYQTETKTFAEGKYFLRFNRYTFREIDWREDKNKKETLFIGSPWSLPEKDLKEGEILHRIYLSNGALAFLIVSPK